MTTLAKPFVEPRTPTRATAVLPTVADLPWLVGYALAVPGGASYRRRMGRARFLFAAVSRCRLPHRAAVAARAAVDPCDHRDRDPRADWHRRDRSAVGWMADRADRRDPSAAGLWPDRAAGPDDGGSCADEHERRADAARPRLGRRARRRCVDRVALVVAAPRSHRRVRTARDGDVADRVRRRRPARRPAAGAASALGGGPCDGQRIAARTPEHGVGRGGRGDPGRRRSRSRSCSRGSAWARRIRRSCSRSRGSGCGSGDWRAGWRSSSSRRWSCRRPRCRWTWADASRCT